MIVCLRADIFLGMLKKRDGFSGHTSSVCGPLLRTLKEILGFQKTQAKIAMDRIVAQHPLAGEKLAKSFCSKRLWLREHPYQNKNNWMRRLNCYAWNTGKRGHHLVAPG